MPEDGAKLDRAIEQKSRAIPASPDDGAPQIEARGVCKAYGPIVAVENLSFSVGRGEIVGLLGPNGAGKSTALRMLVGFQYPDAGEVRLAGRDVWRDGPDARASLGYLPESAPLYPEMTVVRYLAFFADLKRVPSPEGEVRRVADRLDLGEVLGRPCGNLSRGYRQRVGLAQALLGDPSILILDEPTAGLDPNQIHDVRGLLRELGRERSLLLSTHILPEALEVCDRIVILRRGRAVAEGRPHELVGEGTPLHWARLRVATPPTEEDRRRFGLEPDGADPSPRVWRLGRELPREEARALLRLCVERDWDVLEWGSGAAGLESIFRRVTLGSDGP